MLWSSQKIERRCGQGKPAQGIIWMSNEGAEKPNRRQ